MGVRYVCVVLIFPEKYSATKVRNCTKVNVYYDANYEKVKIITLKKISKNYYYYFYFF